MEPNITQKKTQDNYPGGDPNGHVPEDLLVDMRKRGIDLFAYEVTQDTKKMLEIFKEAYDDRQTGHTLQVVSLSAGPDVFKPMIIQSITASMAATLFRASQVEGAKKVTKTSVML